MRIAIGCDLAQTMPTAEGGAPPVDQELNVHYGQNAGEILLHLPLSDPSHMTIVADNIVQTVASLGGGSYPDATGSQITWTGSETLFKTGTADNEKLLLSTALDLDGGHILIPLKIYTAASGTARFFGEDDRASNGATGAVLIHISETEKSIRFLKGGVLVHASGSFTVADNAWAMLEIRVQGGQCSIWHNGGMVDLAPWSPGGYLIDCIGHARQENGKSWQGSIGDVVFIPVSDDHNHVSPEPAALAARSYLMSLYAL
ncbi:hypothetical protein [Palleronia caenipelagi]|uniref:Uncharacterized protein n=1 Tax=Palleronia caenipelagi TaxID=2489174 RepID=A0A547Q0J8_9RHOB|nr:hypothetical protein [Palleronia caenipelagi]TRD19818.1 hypothetical protein FEV53_10260 [Palleronia caenipelagi]